MMSDRIGPVVRRQRSHRYDQVPAYFVYGGLVFQTLTRDYLTTWDKWWNKAPKEFLNYYYLGYRSAEQHEVVRKIMRHRQASFAALPNQLVPTQSRVRELSTE